MNKNLWFGIAILATSFTACKQAVKEGGKKGPDSLSNAVVVSQLNGMPVTGDPTSGEALLAIPDIRYKPRINNLGTKKFAHVMIEFSDGSSFPPGYKDEMQRVMADVKVLLDKSSYGQMDAQIETLGIYRITSTFTSDVGCFCTNGSTVNKMGIAQLQDKVHFEMIKDGVNLEDYDFVAYHFAPHPTGRCSGGNGVLGGSVSVLFDTPNTPEYLSRGIVPLSKLGVAFVHEWGHNLGMAHNNNNGGNYIDGRNTYNGWFAMGMIQGGWDQNGVGQPYNADNLISAGWLQAHSIAGEGPLAPAGRVYRIYSLSKPTAAGDRVIEIPVEGTTRVFHLSYPTSEAGTFYANLDGISAQQNLIANNAVNITIVDLAGWSNAGCTHLASDNSFSGSLAVDGQIWVARDYGIRVERLNTVDNGSEKYVEVLVSSVDRSSPDSDGPDVEIKTPIAGGHHSGSYVASQIDVYGGPVEVKVAASDPNGVSAVHLVIMPFLQNSFYYGTQITPTADGMYTFSVDDSQFCKPNEGCVYTVKALAVDMSGNQSQGDLVSVFQHY